VRKVLLRLQEFNLFVKGEKCEFHKDQVDFLGFVLGSDGVSMHINKTSAIREWPEPRGSHTRKIKDLQAFLGFCNFYRRFIHQYSEVVAPLTALLRKDAQWHWGTAE